MDAERAKEITQKVFLPTGVDRQEGPFQDMNEFIKYYQYLDDLIDRQIPKPVKRYESIFPNHEFDEKTGICKKCGMPNTISDTVLGDNRFFDKHNECPHCKSRVLLHPVRGDHKNICDVCGQLLLPPILDDIIREEYKLVE